jgi:hypothetical protein
MKRALLLSLLALAFASTAQADTRATCSVSPNPAKVGEPVTFSATGLQSGATAVEIIASYGPFPKTYFDLGHVSSYSFQFTFDHADLYSAVWAKDVDRKSLVYVNKCSSSIQVVG